MTPDPSPAFRDASVERVVRARRMIRSYTDEPIAPAELDRVLELARRAPSAGNTAAIEFIVLDTPDDVDRYWSCTLTEQKRARFRWQGLLRAPTLVIIATSPGAYVQRYAEADKARARLGASPDGWAQPFWWIDAGMVAQNILLLATAQGWGASLFGIFDHESDVRATFSVPDDRRLVCTIALGHPSDRDEPGRSAQRPRPPLREILHRGGWPVSPR